MSSQTENNDWMSWIPIVILFCIGIWPVALFLLLRKVLGMDGKKRQSRHPYDIQREQQQAAQSQSARQQGQSQGQTARPQGQDAQQQGQTAQRQPGPSAQQYSQAAPNQYSQAAQRQYSQTAAPRAESQTVPPKGPEPVRKADKKADKKAGVTAGQPKLPRGRGLTIAGAIVTGIFSFGFLSELIDVLSLGGPSALLREIGNFGGILGFLALGVVMMGYGISRTRKGRRFRKYLALIGRRESVPIESLSKAAGVNRRKLMDDLQDMLDRGLLPMGYLDLDRDLLVISDEGIPVDVPQPEPAPAPEPEKAQDDNAVLLEIRQVNDAIPDPVMSAKIDRIGEITGKILDYQRQNPGKDGQLRSFLNYYLPTTLKILRAYAQLDAQGVEGENISAAKARIEGMMDMVVEGFEKQLDKLFRDSVMDISSDVSVLEQMLEKDGLSGQNQGLTLGG